VQENRVASVAIRAARSDRKNPTPPPAGIGPRVNLVLRQNGCEFCGQIELHHHRANDAVAVLGIVNALRFAATRPTAGPSGIDDASARHELTTMRWWSPDDGSQRC
jgi:hypothetical protein